MWLLHVETMAACVWSRNGQLKGGMQEEVWLFSLCFLLSSNAPSGRSFHWSPQHQIKTTKGTALHYMVGHKPRRRETSLLWASSSRGRLWKRLQKQFTFALGWQRQRKAASTAAIAPWERTSKSTQLPAAPSSSWAEASFSASHPWLRWVRNQNHPSEPQFGALAARSLLLRSLRAACWQLFHRAKDPSLSVFPYFIS